MRERIPHAAAAGPRGGGARRQPSGGRGPGAGPPGGHDEPGARAARAGVTAARVVAAEVLADMRAGDLLDPVFERRAAPLEPRDRRWTQELVWGMLRQRGWLDAILDDRVKGGLARLDPDLTDLLRLGGHPLLYMGSVPAYAAIAQTVELAKRRHGLGASKLANAVLRRVDRDRADLRVVVPAGPVDALALRHSHPRWLVARWVEQFGRDATEQLLLANNQEAEVFARPWGIARDALALALHEAGVRTAPAPLVDDGLRLSGLTALTELGAYRQGLFFVQDPAATLVARFAAVPAGAVVADLCAAPGGKALELARTARLVVAVDRSVSRLRRVAANVARLRAATVHAVAGDARTPVVGAADVVLLDVPCTGTGTFRRHPDARWRLRISDLAALGALQRELLAAATAVVRPGGLLVYSTCSLEPEENDAQVAQFLAAHPDWTLEPPPAGAVPDEARDGAVLRVLPQRHGTDGAFAARLRRPG